MSGQTWEDEALDVVIGPSSTPANRLPQEFEVIVHDRQHDGTDPYGNQAGFWARPLQKLIPMIRVLAGSDKPVGPLLETKVASATAYEFTVNDYIGWNGFGRAIDEQNLWVFLENSSTVLELSLPNTSIFQQILETLEFTPGSSMASST